MTLCSARRRQVPSTIATAAILLAANACGVAHRHSPEPLRASRDAADADALKSDIVFLASDALEGRGTGTAGNDSAAAYIARRFGALKLQAVAGGEFEQHFVAHPLSAHRTQSVTLQTENVVGMLPGTDSALRTEYVVVGAHFDHLGRSTEGALDPDRKNVIRHGADDNASGTAAVLELARLFARRPARRSLVFVTFSGEELGLLWSEYFVANSPLPLDSAVAMVNFDMVGRLRDDKLIVYGVATATELPALLDSANAGRSPLRITALGDGYGPSDHSSFYARNIPVLHFFTDLHEDYHSAGDVATKINAPGEARVVNVAARVIREIADRPTRLTFVRSSAPPQTAGSRQGSDVYLGSIPDMSEGSGHGLRLTGVRSGSPADVAGLVAGDVVLELGGHVVKDLYDFSDALYSHRPGDSISVTVLRNGDRKQFMVTLGKRS